MSERIAAHFPSDADAAMRAAGPGGLPACGHACDAAARQMNRLVTAVGPWARVLAFRCVGTFPAAPSILLNRIGGVADAWRASGRHRRRTVRGRGCG
jgi:hypothetical protein